ncbi:MAG TPA: BatD family protein [Opitutaceae bacterium]
MLTSLRHRSSHFGLLLFVLGLLPTLLRAQNPQPGAPAVRWEIADQGMMSAAVQLVFENCTPDNEPTVPQVPNATLQLAGRSNSTNIVNFQMTQSVIYVYMVRTRGTDPVRIPSFDVKTNKGTIRVDAFNLAAPSTTVDTVAFGKFMPQKTTVWAGEVFGLVYELSASRRNNPQINPTFEWNAAPLVAEDWSKYEFTEKIINNDRRALVTFRTRAVAKNPGSLKLEAATHLISIQTGSIASFFGPQPRMEQVAVTSDQPVIDVRPLPNPPAGFAAFSGAVGQFNLVSKVVPEKASVGEPVTWTLELTGAGNWPDIAGLPARNVSNDFRVVQPKAKRTPAEGKLFDVALAEDVVLVPTKPGTYTLGPVEFVYFDPTSGTYQKKSVAPVTLTIAPAAGSQFAPSPATAPAASGNEPQPPAAAAAAPVKAPALPTAIPRDPLPGVDVVATPLNRTTLVLAVLAPFVALLGCWAWLAIRRARVTDPVRPRREARQRLAVTLHHLGAATDGDRTALILAWQRDTRLLWQIAHAAPASTALKDATWAALWRDADRALYGSKPALPAVWVARAQEALAAKRVPGFQPLRLFLPQNLMPFAAGLALMFVATGLVLHAAELDGGALYRKGDFAGAEKSWRAVVNGVPANWIARHNLSLALAQQDRSPESAAHAAAAFVQHPSEPSVRFRLAQSAERSGFADPLFSAFMRPDARRALARLASPAQWQRVIIAGAALCAFAFGLLLANAYGSRRRGLAFTAVGLAALALITAAAGIISIRAYGITARPDAAIVARGGTLRSIPTDADVPQKTSPLSPGSLAVVEKTFLEGRWLRISFENGQTGWVRKEDLVQIWR